MEMYWEDILSLAVELDERDKGGEVVRKREGARCRYFGGEVDWIKLAWRA